jgi:hypothetical protein
MQLGIIRVVPRTGGGGGGGGGDGIRGPVPGGGNTGVGVIVTAKVEVTKELTLVGGATLFSHSVLPLTTE